jgi:hypothetical protein
MDVRQAQKKIKITLIEREEAGHFFVAWHTWRTPGVRQAYDRRKKKLKSL